MSEYIKMNDTLIYNYQKDIIDEKDKEIERLKEELEYTIPIVEHNKTTTKHLKEIERLNNIINEIYTKANDTNITSLDLRDYILNNLGVDKK